jgi:adenylate cyclase
VRVRIGSSGAVLTVKAGRGLSRTEVELALTAEQAEALWPHTEGRQIEKTRYRIELTGPTGPVAELDSYAGSLDGLHTVEVEFGSVAAAEGFVAPAWFGRELTGDGAWTNASLARMGRPAG